MSCEDMFSNFVFWLHCLVFLPVLAWWLRGKALKWNWVWDRQKSGNCWGKILRRMVVASENSVKLWTLARVLMMLCPFLLSSDFISNSHVYMNLQVWSLTVVLKVVWRVGRSPFQCEILCGGTVPVRWKEGSWFSGRSLKLLASDVRL